MVTYQGSVTGNAISVKIADPIIKIDCRLIADSDYLILNSTL
jgi:hypothetical protein